MNAGDVTFHVTPEALLAASSAISTRAERLYGIFEQAQRCVDSMPAFWQGEAARAYRDAYYSHKREIEEILARLREHVIDLNEIAGNYQFAEQWVVRQTETLPEQAIQ